MALLAEASDNNNCSCSYFTAASSSLVALRTSFSFPYSVVFNKCTSSRLHCKTKLVLVVASSELQSSLLISLYLVFLLVVVH